MIKKNIASLKITCSVMSLFLTVAVPVVLLADSKEKDQERTINQLYGDFGYIWCNEGKMSKLFEKTFAEDVAKACDSDLIMEIGSPVIPGNDYDEKEITRTLKVECKQQAISMCTAVFESFGASHIVKYHLKEQAGNWLITDIIDDQGSSYRSALSKALK